MVPMKTYFPYDSQRMLNVQSFSYAQCMVPDIAETLDTSQVRSLPGADVQAPG